jgi:sugar phosphate isomerase/epimerase
MVRRRAKAAGITIAVGNHTFRDTGITAYLERRHVRKGAPDGGACVDPHHPAL